MRQAILLIMAFSFCASISAQEIKTRTQDLADEVGSLDLKSGITNEQSVVIAQYYCDTNIAGCGSAHPAIDRGSTWEVTPHVGTAGTPSENIIKIEKHTGIVSSKDGPTLDFAKLFESKDEVPQLIKGKDRKGKVVAGGANSVSIKVQFTVLPNGATTGYRFRTSSSSLKCDAAARKMVERWKFQPRENAIDLVAKVNTCAQ